MNEITIVNVGPVDQALIPLEEGGGITILRGVNGCGKSTLIDSVGRLAGGKQAVSCADGAARGTVEGLGVRVSVQKTTRRTGECEATSLTGKFDLSDFVDPPIKNPDAADRARILALLAIRGVEADVTLFHPLVGGERAFTDLVGTRAAEAKDLVEQARLVKVDLEHHARSTADAAKKEEGKAASLRESAESLDEETETDGAKLQEAFARAVGEEAEVRHQRVTADKARQTAEDARERLADATADYRGPWAHEAKQAADAADAAIDEAEKEVNRLERELEVALSAQRRQKDSWRVAVDSHETARSHEASMAAWAATIEQSAGVEDVTDEALTDAVGAVEISREAIEAGAIARKAVASLAHADIHGRNASSLTLEAERYRDAARATDTVLSAAVASPAIRVEAGRLVVDHPNRGRCLFGELSKGEKWTLALQEAVTRIREIGAEGVALIPIPQEAWEGLDPDNRRLVWEEAKRLKVNIIAAACSAGPLGAVAFDPEAVEDD